MNNYSKIIDLIDKYEYVSFDMFDTLIKRDCPEPRDIQRILGHKLGPTIDFYKLRLNAESYAWEKSSGEEVTLEQIYDVLKADYPLFDWNRIQKQEIEMEYNYCTFNNNFQDILEFCKTTHKKIIIATDMYLNKTTIDSILKKNRIKYDYLYLSSDCGYSKRDGSMFDYILKDLNINKNDIIHIGDNLKSDYLRPLSKGIHAIKIPTEDIKTLFHSNRKEISNEYINVQTILNNHFLMGCSDFFYQSGAETLGPILYGFCMWLEFQIKKNHHDKIFFLARDGQILKQQYDKIKSTDVLTSYMYASRRALIVPTLWLHADISELQSVLFFPRLGSIRQMLKKIGLSDSFINNLDFKGFDIDKIVEYKSLFSDIKFLDLYENKLKQYVIENSKKEYELLLEYFKQIGFCGNIAIVDIGWNGNMQRALQEVCQIANIDVEIDGYYVCLNPDSNNIKNKVISARGYLCDYVNNTGIYYDLKNYISMFELFFSADHGTVIKFEKKESIIPVLGEWEFETYKNGLDDYKKINRFQDGAKKYCDIVINNRIFSPIDAQISSMNMIKLGNNPSCCIAKEFGKLRIIDDEVQYLSNPKSLKYYLFHIKELKYDFIFTPWKIGFLKQLLKINFPYAAIVKIMRNLKR